MIQPEIAKAINDQINAEMWSGYLYLSMACNFRAKGLKGVANWFQIQYKEEMAHADALMDYLDARGGVITLAPIAGVKTEWATPAEAFADTLAHEMGVTKRIHNLYAMAEEAKDYATRQMLNAFIAEQVEEEDNVQTIIDDFNLVGEDGTGILQLDRELGARTFTAPTLWK